MQQIFSALLGNRAAAQQADQQQQTSRSASDERDAFARALRHAAAAPSPPSSRAAAAAAPNPTPSPAALVLFTSPRCALCRSLAPDVKRAREAHGDWLDLVEVTADDPRAAWAPEMLAYGVETVPCFVLLSRGGRAVARSGRPQGRAHAQRSLAALVRLAEAGV